MKNNSNNNSLIKINENSIFYKIKKFFRNFFSKKENNITPIEKQEIVNNKKESFRKTITNIETDETRLLKLQKQFDNGEITEEELTDEQVEALLELYQNQIDGLRKSNERRKKKLLQYRENMKKAI